ncbi:MAG: deoxyuridine 5'-triphosphate nucleotidohydrolase [Erysipelotrichaceae bacterium]|nr:deoxyuridine 5'-triphosphate nucleotidohydrolase [Erysipelotrichaceae bacterium]
MSIARFEKVSKNQFDKDLKDLLNLEGDYYDNIVIPARATKGSAGYDFTCPVDITIKPNELVKIPSGIRCFIEDGYVLNIYPRSSLGFKYQLCLANTTGIIDADYYGAKNEGHIIVALVNRGTKDIVINKGDRFVQGIFFEFFTAEEELVDKERTGGFGSSN